MPAYRADGFTPPAPFAWSTVHGPNGRTVADVPLLLDTGSDISIVPRSAAQAVGAATMTSTTRLEFYDGSDVPSQTAALTIQILRYSFRGLFVVSDAEYGVIGRDILNSITVTFDGPHLTWSV